MHIPAPCFAYFCVSENVVYPFVPNGFHDHKIPIKNGYFIGNINQTFSDKAIWLCAWQASTFWITAKVDSSSELCCRRGPMRHRLLEKSWRKPQGKHQEKPWKSCQHWWFHGPKIWMFSCASFCRRKVNMFRHNYSIPISNIPLQKILTYSESKIYQGPHHSTIHQYWCHVQIEGFNPLGR